jgi:threonine dehydrogenase-like Zn-dependent dehydrogenase
MYRIYALPVALMLTCSGPIGVAAAADVAILMPGSSGIVPGDFLVRNEANFKRAGIRTILTTSPSAAAQSVAAEAAQKRKSVIVGMSRGAADAAEALAAGAKPAGVVFVSGVYGRVIPALRSPDLLPATLVVHHSRDICKFTLPGAASEFVAWARGKARLQWINTTGEPSSNPCNARGAHGFFRQDGPAVAAIVAFIKSR